MGHNWVQYAEVGPTKPSVHLWHTGLRSPHWAISRKNTQNVITEGGGRD